MPTCKLNKTNFPINECMLDGGGSASPRPQCVRIQRRLVKICVSNRDLSKYEKHCGALLHCQGKHHQLVLRPLLSGQAVTIRAERLERLTVCYSWGCPSSVLAGTNLSLRSSALGTTSLPLQREKPSIMNAMWKETHPPGHIPPRGSAGNRRHLKFPKGDEAQDEAEEMPPAL